MGILKKNLQNDSEFKLALCKIEFIVQNLSFQYNYENIGMCPLPMVLLGCLHVDWGWYSDLQNFKQISLLFTNSLMKWNLVSMCLVLLWNTWFLDNAMAELLSQKMVVGSYWFCDRSFKIVCIQMSWHEALVAATYFDSTEDRVVGILLNPVIT